MSEAAGLEVGGGGQFQNLAGNGGGTVSSGSGRDSGAEVAAEAAGLHRRPSAEEENGQGPRGAR